MARSGDRVLAVFALVALLSLVLVSSPAAADSRGPASADAASSGDGPTAAGADGGSGQRRGHQNAPGQQGRHAPQPEQPAEDTGDDTTAPPPAEPSPDGGETREGRGVTAPEPESPTQGVGSTNPTPGAAGDGRPAEDDDPNMAAGDEDDGPSLAAGDDEPAISVTTRLDDPVLAPGRTVAMVAPDQPVTLHYTVSNTGGQPLTDLQLREVADSAGLDLDLSEELMELLATERDSPLLPPGEHLRLTAELPFDDTALEDRTHLLTATVTGSTPDGDEVSGVHARELTLLARNGGDAPEADGSSSDVTEQDAVTLQADAGNGRSGWTPAMLLALVLGALLVATWVIILSGRRRGRATPTESAR